MRLQRQTRANQAPEASPKRKGGLAEGALAKNQGGGYDELTGKVRLQIKAGMQKFS